METLRKIMVFFILPVLAVALLYVNGRIQADKYFNRLSDLKQYDSQISADLTELKARPGEKLILPLDIKNTGTMSWLSDGKNSINLSYHILDENKKMILNDGERTAIPGSVKSGEAVQVNAQVKAPEKAGIYYIEFDMVHEGVTWFEQKGSKTLTVRLEVKP
ncbi:MAG: hypothetical protein NUV45_13230 [Tepidanaerobacteraceae bacterium]|nr:hypothetical protein [Tepidanaerobacteraceae bacterium]